MPCKDFYHDLEAMAAAINSRTRIVYICNPNNPTGNVNKDELEGFLKKMPPGVLIVLDEAYREFVDDPSYPDSLELIKRGSNVLILRTFSKIYGLAGLRVGYGRAPEQIITDLNTVREPFNVNSLAQVAARAALEDEGHLQEVKKVNAAGKEDLAGELKRMGLNHIPTQANFFFIDTGVDSKELFQRLLRKGIIVRTGDIFGYPQHIHVLSPQKKVTGVLSRRSKKHCRKCANATQGTVLAVPQVRQREVPRHGRYPLFSPEH